MGKRNYRGSKELTKEQSMRYEIVKLKEEIAQLRHQLSRKQISKYETTREVLNDHILNEKSEEAKTVLTQLEHHWKCFKCSQGELEIYEFWKENKHYYKRECNNCDHQTRPKLMHENVQGIRKIKKIALEKDKLSLGKNIKLR